MSLSKLYPYRKAIAGFVIGAVAAWLGVRDGGVTSEEWLAVLGAALSGGGLVWAVPNSPKPPTD